MGLAELLIEEEQAELLQLAGEGWGFEAGQFVSAPKRESRAETFAGSLAEKIKLQTWAEWLAAVPETREWTVESILPNAGLVALGGRAKAGKSTLAIHMCRAVALGDSFLGKQTKPKPVLYVNYEMGADYLRSFLSAGARPNKAFIIERPIPVLTTKMISRLMMEVQSPGLMVIDSFRGAFRLAGEGENSAGIAGVLLREIQGLAVTKGWLILLIHHLNKKKDQSGSQSLSGTTDWIAASDVIWTWERTDPNKNGTLAIEGRMPPVEPLSVWLSPSECRYVGTSGGSEEKNEKALILNSLGSGRKTADELASELDIPPGTARKRLQTLETQQKIFRSGEGKRNSPYFWQRIDSAQSPPLGEKTKQRHLGRRVKWGLIPDLGTT